MFTSSLSALSSLPFLQCAGRTELVSGRSALRTEYAATLKRALGPAGDGKAWHHIVEQRGPNIDKFGAEAVHNAENVVAISAEANQAINAYYSSVRPFTNGMTVRNWLQSKSFKEQAEFGYDILARVLNGKPLP